jgi:hypothetical protein
MAYIAPVVYGAYVILCEQKTNFDCRFVNMGEFIAVSTLPPSMRTIMTFFFKLNKYLIKTVYILSSGMLRNVFLT